MKSLKFTIEYVVSPDYLNLQEILEHLRETGSAQVVKTELVDERSSN